MYKFVQSETVFYNLSSVESLGEFLNKENYEDLDWSLRANLLLLCPEMANFVLLTLCLYGMYHGIDIRCETVASIFIISTHHIFLLVSLR